MAKERYFPAANVTFTDTHLLTSDSRYEWSELLYAEVVTKRFPVDWRTFWQVYMLIFLAFALFWAAAPLFGLNDLPGPAVALFWLLITVLAARRHAKDAYKHLLMLETTSGPVEIVRSSYDNLLLEVCEAINKRIKRNAAAPKPVHTGEPTRWIQAN